MEWANVTTVRIELARDSAVEQRTIERIAAAGNEDLADDRPTLYLDSPATLSRFLSEATLELIQQIATHERSSIRAGGELVGRDYKDVHRNLTELPNLGLVRFESGEGNAKVPVVTYDDIEIEIPLGDAGHPFTDDSAVRVQSDPIDPVFGLVVAATRPNSRCHRS